jgi:hypothetical protein
MEIKGVPAHIRQTSWIRHRQDEPGTATKGSHEYFTSVVADAKPTSHREQIKP